MRKGLAIALSAVLLMGLSGCGSEQKPASGTVAQKVAEAPVKEDFKALTEVKQGQKNVYAVVKAFHNPYWQEVMHGMKEAAEASHVNLYVGGVLTDGNWETQKDMIKHIEDNKIDGLILGTADSLRMSEVTKEIRDKKKPVILVDTMLNTQDYDAAFLTNNLQAGAEAAKKMVELLKQNGISEEDDITVGIHVSNLSSRTESERLDSIVANWYGIAPRHWKIDSEYMVNFGDESIGEKLVLDNLNTKQSLKAIFAVNNNCTNITMQAVMKLGRKDVSVMGFDMSDVVREGIERKEYKFATVMQNPHQMGYQAVKAAADAMAGKAIAARDVDTGAAVADEKNLAEMLAKARK